MAKSIKVVSFSAAQWNVATSAGAIAKNDGVKDALYASALKAYRDCKAKDDDAIKAVDTAFRTGYIMQAVYLRTNRNLIESVGILIKEKDADALAARLAAGNALKRLKDANGIKVVDKRGAKKGQGKGKGKTAAKVKADNDKAIQTAAKALAEKAGVTPPAVVTKEATTQYALQQSASLLAWFNKAQQRNANAVFTPVVNAVKAFNVAMVAASAELNKK